VTAKSGPGQADKAAAEERTAQVAKENAAGPEASAGTDAQGAALRIGADATPARADGTPPRLEGVDAAVAPYPLYEDLDVEALRGLGEQRGVEINRDVEKALLIKQLRDYDAAGTGPDAPAGGVTNPYPSYDLMPLDELRSLAQGRQVGLAPVDEKAHWITELRAADSGVNTGGGTTV
jgi:hypothetical protein